MADPSLLILLTVGIFAVVMLRRDLGELRRVRIGGGDEDLSRARTLTRRMLIVALVLLLVLFALVIAGGRWAEDWRRSLIATWALNGLIVALAFGLVRGASRTTRNQWSPSGSWPGIFMGMAEGTLFMILLVPAVYWRLGLS